VPGAPPSSRGHPPALVTLSLTEFWERFSYYGMRALLILYLTAPAAAGGLGWSTGDAAALYGIYTASAYLAALPGGWLVDRVFGQRVAVVIGGLTIASGHFAMAVPGMAGFFPGLILIVLGTGVLKPAVTSMVGVLYPEGGARRDAGFSIFYMGINLGAAVAPLVTGYLGQRIDWHLGFGVAGLGMVLGLVQYLVGARHLDAIPAARPAPAERPSALRLAFLGGAAAVGLGAVWYLTGTLARLANVATVIIVVATAGFFVTTFADRGLGAGERRRAAAIGVFFLFSAVCWSALEQAGSSLNLFAQRHTDLDLAGFAMPASWLQSVLPTLVIVLAPVFAWLWVALARRGWEPSPPLKFAAALGLIGLGFLVMAVASTRIGGGSLVSPGWLVLAYFLLTLGELSFSPVGYSLVTALSPGRMKSQFIGVWLTSIALGNLIAGQLATLLETLTMTRLFGAIAAGTAGAAGLLLAIAGPLRRLAGFDRTLR
jgi:POT family proton-dependent oligopeptide transporter